MGTDRCHLFCDDKGAIFRCPSWFFTWCNNKQHIHAHLHNLYCQKNSTYIILCASWQRIEWFVSFDSEWFLTDHCSWHVVGGKILINRGVHINTLHWRLSTLHHPQLHKCCSLQSVRWLVAAYYKIWSSITASLLANISWLNCSQLATCNHTNFAVIAEDHSS